MPIKYVHPFSRPHFKTKRTVRDLIKDLMKKRQRNRFMQPSEILKLLEDMKQVENIYPVRAPDFGYPVKEYTLTKICKFKWFGGIPSIRSRDQTPFAHVKFSGKNTFSRHVIWADPDNEPFIQFEYQEQKYKVTLGN